MKQDMIVILDLGSHENTVLDGQSAHWVSIAKSIRTTLRLKNSKHFRM